MTLFTNIAHLHTFDGFLKKEGRRPVEQDMSTLVDGAMLIADDGTIEWIGAQKDWAGFARRKSKAALRRLKKISLKGADVLPAFTECHTHLLYAGSRADEFERRNRGDSYLAIAEAGGGIRSTVLATRKATDRELEAGVIERLRDFANQGVTSVEIKTGYASTIEEEKRHLALLFKIQKKARGSSRRAQKLPRVIVTCLAAHSIPRGETEASWLAKVETILPLLKKNRARLDIFIEQGAFSLKGGAALLKKGTAFGIPVVIHADQLSLAGGTSLGAKLGALSVDHVIEAGPKEIAELAKSKTVAVLLPAADLYTRLPYPKARAMLDAGVRVGLATDHNPGSSPGLDIALVGLLARAGMAMTLPEVLAAYTVNAAAALGLEKKLGALRVGMNADFICLKPDRTVSDLFYQVGPTLSHASIASVWRAGHRIASRDESRRG